MSENENGTVILQGEELQQFREYREHVMDRRQQILTERRASGWLPLLGIAEAVEQPPEQVEQSLMVYGNPKVDANGSYFRWNWVYEWAATQFDAGAHADYIRETAEGILQQAGGDMDRALSAATTHTAKLWATEVVEAVLAIEG